MLLVDALKEVYKALGGSADDVADMSQNADVIAAIATKVGSGLPEVTAEDNGDVLTVIEGAWGKAAPSGGDIVVFSVGNFAANSTLEVKGGKTGADINQAISSGKLPVLIGDDGKVYYHIGKMTNPKGSDTDRNFLSVKVEWDSGNSKYVFRIYWAFWDNNKYSCNTGNDVIG